MNRIRTAFATLGITAGLVMAPTASAAPQQSDQPKATKVRHEPCTGEFRNDARLGPKWLPKKNQAPVGPLLKGYKRTGALAPSAFLKKYWEGPADSGGWKYPPNDGFGEVNGEIDKEPTKLRPGQRLDRFGSEFGSYLAPAGDAYSERALPPQNLNTRDAAVACDYRVYKVAKPFWVWQGSIAPWFEQPGGGQQIKLDPVFLNPGQDQRLNVKWLLERGYLTSVAS
ncbi:glycohydrolase toxin TNT-related protein [Streptomyces albipurpureus]|uniref:TNT domain-containing protein n=1 Tax=Streptomyces albipurpureus TaxID=2897419 RepID=A0ABT0UIM9_9ACTN|nr:TNT domain-containing protein [Streptomyces sp. CWNU-1]MCM2387950.1 TNT domain-containing protein [Streptomyces sp. CWNU-1]